MSTTFERQFSTVSVTSQPESLESTGFVGELFSSSTHERHPAVLLIGDSTGGLPNPMLARLLATKGVPVLTVAYFGEPGLPATLSAIPIEYFAKAARWLAHQPDVDAKHILVMGISRGSEAALLLAVHYPNLIHGVIASTPSDVAHCSYPSCRGPSWTLGGHPLPYTRELTNPSPRDDPAAVIPGQRIQGPVFVDCGEADPTWPSCLFAAAIISRLVKAHDRFQHLLWPYPGAGTGLSELVPNEPAPAVSDPRYFGADQANKALPWPHLLQFVAQAGTPQAQHEGPSPGS